MKVAISRPGAPPTHLFVHQVSKHPERLGAGNRPVSFILPGGPGVDHTGYLDYATLQHVTDLVFHDPRGCGKSDLGERSSYNMNNNIDDVDAIRQQLGLDKINVIGKSYGSMCALGYALRYPQHVNKLVLASGAPSFRFIEIAKKNLLRQGSPEQIAICEKLWKGDFKNRDELLTFFELTRPLYSVKARTTPPTQSLHRKCEQFSRDVLNEGFSQSFWRFDYESVLNTILSPTLILAGRQDWINDVKLAEMMVARIPHSELRVFENASHAMEVDAGDAFFQTIAEFISR